MGFFLALGSPNMPLQVSIWLASPAGETPGGLLCGEMRAKHGN